VFSRPYGIVLLAYRYPGLRPGLLSGRPYGTKRRVLTQTLKPIPKNQPFSRWTEVQRICFPSGKPKDQLAHRRYTEQNAWNG
jgi:hypothetical protein